MLITTRVRFRSRNEPKPYDMSDQGGPIGTSYSINVLDEDDTKHKVKVPQSVYDSLANAKRDEWLTIRLACFNVKGDGPDCIVGRGDQAPKAA